MRFRDRQDAGRALAERLAAYAGLDDVIVLGLPRGGVPVAAEVARALGAPLDVLAVRKLGVPGHEELAMGAIAAGGVRVLDDATRLLYDVPPGAVDRVAEDEGFELARRERIYRDGRPVPRLAGRTVILVDDGLATGSTMRAAVRAVRLERPARVIVAVPVAPSDACALLRQEADECVCATIQDPFFAVGVWYDHFPQTTDDEVRALLRPEAAPRS
jgi:putative phosphoribosyl transferase